MGTLAGKPVGMMAGNIAQVGMMAGKPVGKLVDMLVGNIADKVDMLADNMGCSLPS
ncbi:MAG: hypothetical protein JJU12_01220 [Chlamydiales bacterium]|nr:hypothetical protein [Chlamydiales bacterium]